MTRLLLAIFALLSLGALFVFAETVRRPLIRVIRALVMGVFALVGLLGLGVGITGFENDTLAVGVVGLSIALLALIFGWTFSRSGRQRRHWNAAPAPSAVPMTHPEPNNVWELFDAGLDWVARKQARRARAGIDGFLAERNSSSLTQDHRALLLSCEKRVPELIATCMERCRNATGRERDRYIDETLTRLTQMGEEAERARRAVREADDRQLDVLHRYFDGVAPQDREPLP